MKKLEDESSHLAMNLMDVPRYILELRDEIKALRAEVEVWEYGKPKCEKCNNTGFFENTLRRMDGKTITVLCPCECKE